MKNFSEYNKEVTDADNVRIEERRRARQAEEARLQEIVNKNIPALDPDAEERRDRMRALAIRHVEIRWADLACDACGVELVWRAEDVGFGAGRKEIFDCLGCGWNKSLTRMR